MSEMEFDMENYEEELLEYIREASEGNEGIASLSDADISYLLTLWDEYLETMDLDEDDEDFEVDSDDLYDYVQEALEEDGVNIEFSQDTLIELIEMEEDFVDSLFDEDEEDE